MTPYDHDTMHVPYDLSDTLGWLILNLEAERFADLVDARARWRRK